MRSSLRSKAPSHGIVSILPHIPTCSTIFLMTVGTPFNTIKLSDLPSELCDLAVTGPFKKAEGSACPENPATTSVHARKWWRIRRKRLRYGKTHAFSQKDYHYIIFPPPPVLIGIHNRALQLPLIPPAHDTTRATPHDAFRFHSRYSWIISEIRFYHPYHF